VFSIRSLTAYGSEANLNWLVMALCVPRTPFVLIT
jgi:hypothetical protein